MGSKSRWVTAPPRSRALKPSETPRFIAAAHALAAESKTNRASIFRLVEFLALTGLRFSEAAELSWSEVDLGGATLNISPERMKGKRPFVKPLGKLAASVLQSQRELSIAGRFVFPSPANAEKPIDDARVAIAETCKRAGVVVTPHDLRRTFIRAAALAMLPTARIKALVAHADSEKSTACRYGSLRCPRTPECRGNQLGPRCVAA